MSTTADHVTAADTYDSDASNPQTNGCIKSSTQRGRTHFVHELDSSSDAASEFSSVYEESSRKRKRLVKGNKSHTESSGCASYESDGLFDKSTRHADKHWPDDGDRNSYDRRIEAYKADTDWSMQNGISSFYCNLRVDASHIAGREESEDCSYYLPSDVHVSNSGLTIPKYLLSHLLPHQVECLEWLHHLHERNTGGILGDEMGLGKTVQLVAFVAAMHTARRLHSVLLICPASVLLQWVREFHKWYPILRVVLLHSTGSGISLANRTFAQLIDEVIQDFGDTGKFKAADQCIDRGNGGGVLLTTYEFVRQNQNLLLHVEWDYVVLDEGHRIRNPDAEITLVCKQLKTVHRLILTGTPIQNRLRELWSLFDFIYPGKLGTLPTFEDEFVLPIRTGGYANASKMQIVMAYKCALALKEVINPFMLRRTKNEIAVFIDMPSKLEHVIFCHLSPYQRAKYEEFLASAEVAKVLAFEIRPFRAISILRHLCNHPDLMQVIDNYSLTEDYGSVDRSGKLIILRKILSIWKSQKHRVLLFTQTRMMLDILERYVQNSGYKYCRLDGSTPIRERQSLLDNFNDPNSEIFVFLLTTKAGGIGINLIGANRVLIFDPDWNPSTDMQARERSWRLGQTKQVTVYRLITCGTIEEKIYHRQIFKQYLTTKVLHDPKRKRCFNHHKLRDLFTLAPEPAVEEGKEGGNTETTDLFLAGHVAAPENQALIQTEVDLEPTPAVDEPLASMEADNDPERQIQNIGDNDELLKKLFEKNQIHGVFNHAAVECDGVQNQEADLIEMESSKIAMSAVSALRASCDLVRQQRRNISTPTWTGRQGDAGRPVEQFQPRFGRMGAMHRADVTATKNSRVNKGNSLSSKDIIRKLRTGDKEIMGSLANNLNSKKASTAFVKPVQPSSDQLADQLRTFLSHDKCNQGRGFATDAILDAFAHLIGPQEKVFFRELLRKIAHCQGKRWKLKDEFNIA